MLKESLNYCPGMRLDGLNEIEAEGNEFVVLEVVDGSVQYRSCEHLSLDTYCLRFATESSDTEDHVAIGTSILGLPRCRYVLILRRLSWLRGEETVSRPSEREPFGRFSLKAIDYGKPGLKIDIGSFEESEVIGMMVGRNLFALHQILDPAADGFTQELEKARSVLDDRYLLSVAVERIGSNGKFKIAEEKIGLWITVRDWANLNRSDFQTQEEQELTPLD